MNTALIKGIFFTTLLLAAAVWDMRIREIPDWIPLGLLACGLIGVSLSSIPAALLGLVLTALPYWLSAVVTVRGGKYAVGGVDIKLAAGCGFVLGVWGGILQSILALTLALLTGVIIAKKQKQTFHQLRIPLAPCFCAGGIVAYTAVFAASM